jgi:protein-tyrosine phosphatase
MAGTSSSAKVPERTSARILVMCTANRGRSPIAEAMLRRKLTQRGLDRAITVESAGLCVHEIGRTGYSVPATVAEVAARHGFDLREHRARPLDWRRFPEFDLVIVMEAWQAKTLADAFRPESRKAYTLRELSGVASDLDTPDVAGMPAETLEAFVAEAERCLEAALRSGPLERLVAALSRAPAGERVTE